MSKKIKLPPTEFFESATFQDSEDLKNDYILLQGMISKILKILSKIYREN